MAVFTAVVAAVKAVSAWTITVAGVSVAVGNFILQAAVSLGVSALTRALAGDDRGNDHFAIKGSIRSGGLVPRSFMIGPGVTAGSLVWHTEWGHHLGTPNALYTQVIALSDVPVSGLRRWFINGRPVTLEDTGHRNGLAAVEYRVNGQDHAWIRFHDGTQTAADDLLTGVVSSNGPRRYSASRIGVGIAYAVVTFVTNRELFSGFPASKFELDGIKLYDVSKDSTAGGDGPQRWGDPSTWGGDGDKLPAVQAYNLARGIYFQRDFLSGGTDETATVQLDVGAASLSFEIVGGGGGGGNTASAGGATTVTLKDGATVVQVWTVQGGAAGAAGTGNGVFNAAGGVSALSPRGDGGAGRARVFEGGSEGAGLLDAGATGGGAGEYLAVTDFDISGLAAPVLEITIGAGGAGSENDGRSGYAVYRSDVDPATIEPQWLYGLQGMTAARLPAAHWISQIEKCRAQVESGEGLEPAYRCAGEIPVNSELGSAFEAILTSCAGRMSELGGFYKIFVGAPDAPVAHITDADIVSLAPQSFTPFHGLAETVNGVTASYPSPDDAFAMRSTPPLYNPDYEAEDGGRRLLTDVQLSFVPFPAQAQRLVKGELEAARRARRHTFTLPPRFRKVEPGDSVTMDSVRNGYEAKQFRVDGVIDLPNCDLIVDLTEVDPADHGSWDPDADYKPVTPAPVLPITPLAQAVQGFDPVQANVTDGAGAARRPGLLMQWDPAIEDVSGIKFQVRVAATGAVVARVQTRDFEDGNLPVTEGIVAGQAYEARARYIPASPRPVIWTGWVQVTADDVRIAPGDLSDQTWDDISDDAAAIAAALDEDLAASRIDPIDTELQRVNRDLQLREIEQRSVAEALGVINGQVLWAISRVADVDGRLADAGIVQDPETGAVRIYGLEAEAERVSEVEIRLSAAEANISLSATQAWVNQQISNAVLDPSQIPVLDDLQVQVNQVQLDLDANSAAISAKADQSVVSGLDVRLTSAEVAIDAATGQIALKVDQSEFDAVETRLQSAEVQINTLDGPSITQSVVDTRHLQNAQDMADVATLAQLLQAYEGREAIRTDIAYATQDLHARVDEESAARASIVATLGAAIDGNLGLIREETKVRASENAARAAEIKTLEAETADNSGAITEINRVAADSASSVARAVHQVQLDVSAVQGGTAANASALGGLTTRVSSAEGDIVSVSQDLVSLEARVDNAEGDISGLSTAQAQLTTRVTAAEGEITSQGQDLVSLDSRLTNAEGSISGQATAVQKLDTRVTSAEGTISSQASAITSLQSDVGGNSASISQALSAIDGIEAEYTLRIDNNGHVAGMVLRSDLDDNGVPASEVGFQADKFAIVSADGAQKRSPFVVYTEDTVVGGVTVPAGVYMRKAAIRNGSIGNAEIAGSLKSDNYAEDANGIPTEGIKIDFKNDRIKAAGLVLSRPMVLAQGTFTASGTVSNGSRWSFVNTGIRVGKNDVWQAQTVALVAAAAITSGGTAPGGFDPNNTFWTLNSSIQPGARWFGFPGNQPAAVWRRDPSVLVDPYWASGTDQRLFLAIDLEAVGGVYFDNPKIEWTVFQVT